MLLPDGTVKILDFGLAKLGIKVSASQARVSGLFPICRLNRSTATRLMDVRMWAVGVVVYEMLTARKPFGGEQDIAMAHAILHDGPSLSNALPGICRPHWRISLFDCFEKDAAKRYATASELTTSLRESTR